MSLSLAANAGCQGGPDTRCRWDPKPSPGHHPIEMAGMLSWLPRVPKTVIYAVSSMSLQCWVSRQITSKIQMLGRP